MSQNSNNPTQDVQFLKRRSQKNWVMLGIIIAGVALIWSVTMLKIEKGIEMAEQKKAAVVAEEPHETPTDDNHKGDEDDE